MEYKVVKKLPINVIGVQLHVPSPDQALPIIGQFWETFRTEKTKNQIPNKLKPEHTMAVYTNFDKIGGYDLILGAAVEHTLDVPSHMIAVEIPEQTYGVISTAGSIPEIISQVWQQIWDSNMPRAFTYDFEVYKNESLDSADVDIYIALKPEIYDE